MTSRHQNLENLIEPVIESLGCQLWGLELLSPGRHSTLRIYIDKPGGVTLDDCERVSRQAGALLDVEDPISGEYTLEVSSPGLARPLYKLAQYAANVGENVSVRLRIPFEGRRNFSGRLRGIEGEDIVLIVDDHEYLFPVQSIDKANIVPNFGTD